MENITNSLKEYAKDLGADLCGIAASSQFQDAPSGHHPNDLLPGSNSVIVLACQFPLDQLDVLNDTYTVARDNMNEKMNDLAYRLSDWMGENGMITFPVVSMGPGKYESDGRFRDQLSLKHAAVLAGLGKIGKNTLIINNRFGNMVWLSAIITTRELDSDPLADYEVCPPGCRKCINSCKAKALGEAMMQQQVCYNFAYLSSTGRIDSKDEIILCNACRVVCPNSLGLRTRKNKILE
jgi:epoxyqueuosine reductase